jgi:alpha-L-fucosidase 2
MELVLKLPIRFSAILFAMLLFIMGAARAACEELRDVPYRVADGETLTLDAHIPDGAGPFAAAILVHGGGWVAGSKREYIDYLFKPLADAGFAWFSIDYRLAPKHPFPADAEDVEAAVLWVKSHASQYHVDPKRLALIGESAGGHLVSQAGASPRPELRVAAVVSMYGVHDFVSAAVEWKPLPHEALDLFGIAAVDARTVSRLIAGSPVMLVRPDMPPYLLLHGTKDEDVPYEQSVEMCAAMKAAGAHCELIPLEGAPHGMDHWEPHPEYLWYKKAITDWLRKTLG